MNKVKKIIANNSFFIYIIIMFELAMLIYCSISTSNVPIMDYWRYLNAFVEKSFTSGVTFWDIYSNNGVHRSPLQLLLFLINIKLFHWNTQVSSYLGTIFLIFSAILVYTEIKKNIEEKKAIYLMIILVCLDIFSLGAFELLTQEFAFSNTLRIFSFLLTLKYVNDFLYKKNEKYDSSIWLLNLWFVIVIVFLGGAYGIGLSFAIIAVLICDCIIKFLTKKRFYYNNIILGLGIFWADFLYLYGLSIENGESMPQSIIDMIVDFFKGIVIVCGVSLCGSNVKHLTIILLGVVVIIMHIICFCIYIQKKMYEKSYLPLGLYFYFVIFYGMIYMGRSGFGIEYLAAPRYILDSSLAILADIFIIMWAMDFSKKKSWYNYYGIAMALLIMMGEFCTDIIEYRIAPYRKIYDDNLIEKMLNVEEYSDDDLAVFQANSPDQVRDGISIMKKYKLGVFHYLE